MYNTSLRIVKDPQEAEDIMQESFLSAFGKIKTYQGKVSFGAWLKRIVINNSLDVIKKKRLFFEELNEDYTQLAMQEDALEEELLANQMDLVREGIQKLPDGYRVILSLHLLEGYDHEEIAEILNISSSTSRSQFFRAKQKLLRILK